MAKIAIIIYHLYDNFHVFAKSIQKGVELAGGKADLYKVEELFPQEVLNQTNGISGLEDIPIVTHRVLEDYDAFLFGIPTKFGTLPAQWSAFWDDTSGIWANGSLYGKAAGFFVSTESYGGGQEAAIKNCLSYLVHHGLIFVPLGYKNAFAELANIDVPHGSSPWGAGTLTGLDGSRDASDLELKLAEIQGKTFYETIKNFGVSSQRDESETPDIIKKDRVTKLRSKSITLEKAAFKLDKCCSVM